MNYIGGGLKRSAVRVRWPFDGKCETETIFPMRLTSPPIDPLNRLSAQANRLNLESCPAMASLHPRSSTYELGRVIPRLDIGDSGRALREREYASEITQTRHELGVDLSSASAKKWEMSYSFSLYTACRGHSGRQM